MIPSSNIARVLLGGAAGDCIGYAYEGKATPKGDVISPETWRYSDDTVLTLATCEAIITTGKPDPASIAEGLLAAFKRGPIPGIGSSTLKALRDLNEGGHWALSGCGGERAAGNGAAMRIAPVAFFMSGEGPKDRQTIRDICRITHKSDESYVAALAVVRAMHLLEACERPTALMARLAGELPDTRVRDALISVSELDDETPIADVAALTGTSGFAPESVPLAIFLAARFRDCEAAITASVLCGGDTDTVASVAGQICGALGSTLPGPWLAAIPGRAEIERAAKRLATTVEKTARNCE